MGVPQGNQFRFVRELGDEIVILDDEHAVAHRLDAEAAAVWRACDGRATLPGIAATTGFAPERVREILLELHGLGLLTKEQPNVPAATAPAGDATRRVVLRRAVLAGAVIGAGMPTVRTIVVPTAAQAFNSQHNEPGNQGSSQPGGATTGGPGAGTPPTHGSGQGGGSKGGSGGSSHGGSSHGGSSHGGSSHGGSPHGGSSHGGSSPGPVVKGVSDTSGRGVGVAGSRSTVRIADGHTLPFTGSDVLLRAAVGAGILAAGVETRRFFREPPPPPA